MMNAPLYDAKRFAELRDGLIQGAAVRFTDAIESAADELIIALGLTDAQAADVIESALEFAWLHSELEGRK